MDDPADDGARRRSGASRSRTPDRGRSDHPHGLPDSARFALWFSAWCAGAVSLDDARDGVVGPDAAHDVLVAPSDVDDAGTATEAGLTPLILAMGSLRAAGARSAGLALPVAGDPLGLAGPASFNAVALDVGEAVVVEGADLGLVPDRTGAGVVWQRMPATARRQVPDLAEADTELRAALPRVADELADLDVARWRPEVADELMELRRPLALDVPPGTGGRVQRMLALGTRCLLIVALALEDDGGAVTAMEADRRRTALQPLDRAARRALVAACSVPAGR